MKAYSVYAVMMILGSVGHAEEGHATQPTPQIKALSDSQISGYLEGSGMGVAKVAELNGYPGPDHVLELATELGLNAHQRAIAERLKRSMKKAARLGYWLVQDERRLDSLFAQGQADDEKITPLVQRIGSLGAEIRLVHLRAHLEMRRVLTSDQLKKYEQERGHSVGRE